MNSKLNFIVFLLCLAMTLSVSGQSASTKAAQDLKKAEKVTKTGKALVNVFKKKKKSEKKEVEYQENESNNDIPNTSENNVKVLNSEVSNEVKDDIPLTKEAAILFKNSISKTTNAEKNVITAYMNLKVTADGTQFFIDEDYSRDYPFVMDVYPVDINKDGVEEIALVYGHMALSGDNVISTLFIKNDQGHYIANFGFTGSLIILPNSSKGFPNIALGGPGFEFPVWQWNGKNYAGYGNITDAVLEKSNPLFIEEASKLYVESISN